MSVENGVTTFLFKVSGAYTTHISSYLWMRFPVQLYKKKKRLNVPADYVKQPSVVYEYMRYCT